MFEEIMPNYALEVISHHPDSDGKPLRQYNVDGIQTVGAFEEDFSVRFTNNTWKIVQVKISIDGTDCLTGELADTQPTPGKMWVVQPYGQLELKAWAETNQGGASFRFANANNSVAVHTHGDTSSLGIIAAAVFVEGHFPEPIKTIPMPYLVPAIYPYPWPYQFNQGLPTITINVIPSGLTSTSDYNSCAGASFGGTSQCFTTMGVDALNCTAGVGAGNYQEQNITYTTGLIKPMFTESVQVRYIWWDDLVAKLNQMNDTSRWMTSKESWARPNGFPDDKRNLDLGTTPRPDHKPMKSKQNKTEQQHARF